MRQFKDKNSQSKKYLVNEQIKSKEIRVITDTGENLGVLSRSEALREAEERGLDLVMIGEQDSLVIAKIMDFGKHLYVKKKQQAEAKKHQKVIQIKEIKMRPNIEDQDFLIKFRRAVQFLQAGKRVKFTLQFKGRQMATMKEVGPKFFDRIHAALEEQDFQGTLVAEKEQRGRPFWSKVYYVKSN